MPTYEYQCDDCGRSMEVFQRISERPKRKCPSCGGRIRRLISGGAGLLFKGSGFYITDYRSESYKQAAKAEVSASAAGSSPTPAKDGAAASSSSSKEGGKGAN